MAARHHHGSARSQEKSLPLVIEDRSRKGEVRRWSRGKILGKVRARAARRRALCSVASGMGGVGVTGPPPAVPPSATAGAAASACAAR